MQGVWLLAILCKHLNQTTENVFTFSIYVIHSGRTLFSLIHLSKQKLHLICTNKRKYLCLVYYTWFYPTNMYKQHKFLYQTIYRSFVLRRTKWWKYWTIFGLYVREKKPYFCCSLLLQKYSLKIISVFTTCIYGTLTVHVWRIYV